MGIKNTAISLNKRTHGPVNARLTPGPGIYFNAFLHVYSPRAGADNTGPVIYFNAFIHVYSPRAGADSPWGQMLMSTGSPYHFAHLLQVLKQSLLSLILCTFFHIFPHVYNPGQGQTTYWGPNFDDNRKAFSLRP